MTSTSKVLDISNELYDYNLYNKWDVAIQAMYVGPLAGVADDIDLYFSFYA